MHPTRLPIVIAVLWLCATAVGAQPPDFWNLGSRRPGDFRLDADQGASHLKSTGRPETFGTLRRSIDAGPYLGRRLRLSAAIKAEGVSGWAGMWMRVDGQQSRSFDNMCNRPILDSSDWTNYEIVLDVQKDAEAIVYGLLLSPTGPSRKKVKNGAAPPPAPTIGEVWIKDVRFDVVNKKVKTTGNLSSCGEWSRSRQP